MIRKHARPAGTGIASAAPAPSVHDQLFQDQLLAELARFTATRLV